MKHISLKYFIILLIINTKSFSQCNCKINYFNNQKIKNCTPLLVTYDKNYQIGISLAEINFDKYLILTVRFNNESKTIDSDLVIFTSSNKIINLQILDSEKDYVGESEISNTKYKISSSDLKELSSYNITSIRFNFTNEDIKRTFSIKKNSDIIIKQIDCF
jgi:hypothetical protein